MSMVQPVTWDISTGKQVARQDDDLCGTHSKTADDALLRQFIAGRDEAAFAELVSRHAPLVMGVCRRALGNEQDAEDAFQATFLVLARKAATLRRAGSLSAWLYQTAYRIALRARAGRSRRREQPLEAEKMTATETFSQIAGEHQQSVLDEELNRLPEKYRLPLFLCCVEGKSREEAAQQLGMSAGAVKGRLERGRQLLRRRLMFRGVSLSVALGMLVGLQRTSQAAQAVTPSLIASTVQAGMQYAAGQSAAGLISQNALSLANGSFQVMSWTATKVVAGCLVFVAALAVFSNWAPAPVTAGGDGHSIELMAPSGAADRSVTTVALLAAGERAGQRQPSEGQGERRSAEAEAGPRRSPEAETGPRRSAEGDRGPRRSAEAEGRREGDSPLQGFKPQTRREAALYQMILQLQREVAELRRAVDRSPERERGAGGPEIGRRDGEVPAQAAGWERTKAGGVFRAYDKNGDSFVDLEEWLAMTNGNVNAARKQLQTKRYLEIRPGPDGKLSPAEFIYWWDSREGSQRGRRDGDRAKYGPRDGEGSRSAEDEGQRRSPEAQGRPRRSGEGADRPRDRE